jgi:hypothetical protein
MTRRINRALRRPRAIRPTELAFAEDCRGWICFINATTSCALLDEAGVRVAATVPFSWANTDTIDCAGIYEAA